MMQCCRTFDDGLVKRIVTHPVIFDTVSDDCISPEDFKPELIDECWVSVRNECGEVVAVYNFHHQNAVTLQMHAHVLPEFRLKYAKDASWAALKWIMENTEGVSKLVILVPSVYPKTVNFVKKFGFGVEGVNTLSDMVKGVLCDRVILGATFEEIQEIMRNRNVIA